MHSKSAQAHGLHNRRRRHPRGIFLAAAVLIAISAGLVLVISTRNHSQRMYRDLAQLWKNGAYRDVYEESGRLLEYAPLDFFLLSLRGYAAYQLTLAQINTQDIQMYTDESISALRKALLCNGGAGNGAVYYVLGKAYFEKGPDYANLTIKYLEDALAASYRAEDIPEYLGLAYAQIHEYRKSIAAFSEALVPVAANEAGRGPSDILLLAIARSYIELDEYDSANAYLLQCTETSKDFSVIASAGLLLGKVLIKKGDTEGAERQYLRILNEGGEQADARYELGLLYAERGETTKARAEWRKVLRLDPAYAPAIARLAM
ncbi:MAG: tetratricopeptide repeat protein [Spirochaetaceae bacterium]|nr:tetratricopeptide repeat protein [Spirochaetaceae bacterium]